MTGELVKNLKCLKTKALVNPRIRPISIEDRVNAIKLSMMANGVHEVNVEPGPAKLYTVLNKMILTASFVIPSPKTKLNNLGCFWGLITAIAATTSELHIKEHIRRISITDSLKSSYMSFSGMYFCKVKF